MDTGWYIPITLFVLLTNYMRWIRVGIYRSLYSCSSQTTCDGYGLVYTDHFIRAPHKLHAMDTGWYIPITLFVLLTNYMRWIRVGIYRSLYSCSSQTTCDGYGLVYTDHFIRAPHKLHVMDTGRYIPITLFVLLTNYMRWIQVGIYRSLYSCSSQTTCDGYG